MRSADESKLGDVPDSSCPLCGEPLTATAPGCMRCLLRGGLDDIGEGELSPVESVGDFGDYEIARRDNDGSPWELGRGSMGVTYRGHDAVLHNPVALKIIDADLAAHPRAQARFLREARAAAGLRHPNIAGVFRFGVCPDGKCYYAMELVEGETLEACVRRDGPMAVGLALEITEQVTSALLAAEKCGVVHRDLKPSNIMLVADEQSENAAPVVKVIDFGLAKAAATTSSGHDPGLTIGGFVGTPGFASPEQFDPDVPLDTRSDIFSLGVTLWYLLTGNVPFVGHSLKEIRQQQLQDQLPMAQLKDARLPEPVVALLRDLLAADLKRRPQSARALSERLRQCREQLAPARWPRTALSFAAMLLLAAGCAWFWVEHRPSANAVTQAEKSIAVLPFENLSAANENAFFTDGIQNDIIASLARVAGLKVISRTSVASYRARAGGRTDLRETGRALGVAYLLEGSVQRAGDKVRVSAQLIDARTEAQIWSKHYDRELAGVFAIQDELAERIAADLNVKLSPAERAALQSAPTADVGAYDLRLRARQLLNAFADTFQSGEMLPEAIRLLDAATARDPNFQRAWCDLVDAHMDLYWYGFDRTPERLALAKAALDNAVRLNPDAGETHLVVAGYYYHGFRDYERARTELALARITLPNSAEIFWLLGNIVRRQGLWDESDRNLRHALELDPRNPSIREQVAINLRVQRRYAELVPLLDEGLAHTPGSSALRQARARVALDAKADPTEFRNMLAAMLREEPTSAGELSEGMLEGALCARDRASAEQALALVPAGGIPVHGGTFPRAWFEGVVAQVFGEETRARAAFESARMETERAVRAQPDFAIALSILGQIDARLGRRDDAINAANRAVELLPVKRDAITGAEILINLADTLAWAGEEEAAMDRLEQAADVPSRVSYGLLKLQPRWDLLRGNPRFAALLAKLKPADED